MNYYIWVTLAILAFAIVMFIWEKISLALTSMIVVIALILTGVLDPAQGFSGFVNGSVILFFSMFIVGGALAETGAATQMASLVTKFAKTERQTIILLMIFAALLSGFVANTAAAAIFIPITLGISIKTGIFRSKLLMPMAFATSMGGGLTLVSTPPNLIVQGVLTESTHYAFNFFDFAIITIPRMIIGIVYFAFIGYKLLPNLPNDQIETAAEIQSQDYSDIPQWKRITSVIILVLTTLGMVFENQIGVPNHVVSSMGAVIVVALGIINEKQAYKSVDMPTIFLFSGTLALATALDVTGTGALIANTVIGFLGDDPSPMLLLFTILLITGVLTQVMSNTASTAVLAPIVLSIAIQMNIDPRAALMAVATGSTLSYASPIATPPNTMVYGIGGYKFMDYVKNGIPIIIIVIIVASIILPIFFPFYP